MVQFKIRILISHTTTSILLQFIVTVFKFLQNPCNLILQTTLSIAVICVCLLKIGQYYPDTGNAISREQFKNDCSLIAFDLTPQLDSAEVGFKLIKHGNIQIEIHFADAVVQTLTAVFFC